MFCCTFASCFIYFNMHLLYNGEYEQAIPLLAQAYLPWAAYASSAFKVLGVQLCLAAHYFAVGVQLRLLQVYGASRAGATQYPLTPRLLLLSRRIWDPWGTAASHFQRSVFFRTVVLVIVVTVLHLVLQIIPSFAPDLRVPLIAAANVLFMAQTFHLVALFSIMGRGLDGALRKVIDTTAASPAAPFTPAAAALRGQQTGEPFVSHAMRRNMLLYRKGSIPIGVVAVLAALINAFIADQGGVGRAAAKFCLITVVPSLTIACSAVLLLKTIPAPEPSSAPTALTNGAVLVASTPAK